jgi:hypothetical protein
VREIFWEKKLEKWKTPPFVKKKFWEIFLKIWDMVYPIEKTLSKILYL